jgi:hypothetical protein
MGDYAAQRIIEALRSGISSREVGRCFSSARPKLLREMQSALDKLSQDGISGGSILSGKYGEGKTQLLNTVYSMAHEKNMAVSMISLSKEAPIAKLNYMLPKLLQGTTLPGIEQPGIVPALERLFTDTNAAHTMLEFCLAELETNRLYFVLKAYLQTEDNSEERYRLQSDLEGNLLENAYIKAQYKISTGAPAKFDVNFVKTRHVQDYFAFHAKLFLALGYSGWVILLDEAELLGRLGKKARLTSYLNLYKLIHPELTRGTYCLAAFNSTFALDVIETKNEYANVEEAAFVAEDKERIVSTLNAITSAAQLAPLSRSEMFEIFTQIEQFHALAYGWHPNLKPEIMLCNSEKHGKLLRTQIRAAVEMLDQLYQYGEVGEICIGALDQGSYVEDESQAEESSLDSIVERLFE